MIRPKLNIKFLGININSFHFFGVSGFIAGTLLGVLLCYNLHLRVTTILLMSLIGAGVFFVLALIPKVFTGKETIVYYHHEVAILLACTASLKAMHLPVLPYIDVVLAGVATFLAFGRIGCFSVGCCHGRPSKHGVFYGTAHVQKGFANYYRNVCLMPVQLIESTFVFLVLIVSVFIVKHYLPGTFLIFYTAVYGAFRFGIEFFRGDAARPYWNGLSEAQWTTLVLVNITLILSLVKQLPLYGWHVMIAVVLVLIALFSISRKKLIEGLFSAKHTAQIAIVLHKFTLDDSNSDQGIQLKGFIMYTTDQGLKISRGILKDGEAEFHHYTFSATDPEMLNDKTVRQLAKLIKIICGYRSLYQPIKNNESIFQVVFKEPVCKERILRSAALPG